MIERWVSVEAQVFTAILFATIILVALLEEFIPRRNLNAPKALRWSGNLLIYVIDVAIVRLAIPFLSVGMAVIAADRGWGLLNLVTVPTIVAVVISFVVIDFTRYLQHYWLHSLPWLWRLHLVHHTDQDYDFSTGLRFHPLESLFTVIYEVAVIFLLGPPIIAVLVYETVKAIWSVVAHANLDIPLKVDRAVRPWLVTPDVHRIHHSAEPGETNSNYGGITPVWDKLLGTYIDQPAKGHTDMTIGLPDYQDTKYLKVTNMLLQPFVRRRQPDILRTPQNFD